MTTKLLNLEAIKQKLCQRHIIDNCGIYQGYNLNNNDRLRNILISTVAKLTYDLMGHYNHDSLDIQRLKKTHMNILNCPDTYKQQIDVIVDIYNKSFVKKKTNSTKADLIVIDEYAMINPETLYFLIRFLEITSNANKIIFILSGDPDQMEPINHELKDLDAECKHEQG